MKTSLLVALAAASTMACSASPDPSEAVSAQGADFVETGALGPLESNLGLVHDADRVRSEETLQAGPCYQEMQSSNRAWNLRRYETGAAFFFTDKDGDPDTELVCLDLDAHGQTVAFEGEELDLLRHFAFGPLLRREQGTDLSAAVYSFRDGTFMTAHASVTSIQLTQNPIPSAALYFTPSLAHVAYRYGEQKQTDVGQYLGMDALPMEQGQDGAHWMMRYEKLSLEYTFTLAQHFEDDREDITVHDSAGAWLWKSSDSAGASSP